MAPGRRRMAGFTPLPSAGGLRSLICATLLTGCLSAIPKPCTAEAFLEVADDPSGGVRARATLHLPAPPHVVHAVLTDYERWPLLFNGRFRVVELRREKDRVVTDLLITRSPLPGELRLLCETRDLPNGELVTTGLDGDFTHYVRRWRLAPEAGGETGAQAVGTRADVELSFALRSWIPDWLVREGLRQELLDHFVALQRLVSEHMAHPLR